MNNDIFSTEQLKRYQTILWLLIRHGKTILSKPPELEKNVLLEKTELSDPVAANGSPDRSDPPTGWSILESGTGDPGTGTHCHEQPY